MLEFQVAVYGIFVERLLHARWKLTRDNVTSEEVLLKTQFGFFFCWKIQNMIDSKKLGCSRKDQTSFCIAKKTLYNLSRCIHGFIGYAKEIFKVDLRCEYIPGLHSNQSSIE